MKGEKWRVIPVWTPRQRPAEAGVGRCAFSVCPCAFEGPKIYNHGNIQSVTMIR